MLFSSFTFASTKGLPSIDHTFTLLTTFGNSSLITVFALIVNLISSSARSKFVLKLNDPKSVIKEVRSAKSFSKIVAVAIFYTPFKFLFNPILHL